MHEFFISRWSAWSDQLPTPASWNDWAQNGVTFDDVAKPELSNIPPLIRRRLGSLGRVVMAPLMEGFHTDLPVVFCSQHGEVNRTLDLLTSVAKREELSPNKFSLSVHNAIGGIYSIATKNKQNITAISGSSAGVLQAFLEGYCLLSEGGSDRCLVVVYEEPLPELYQPYCESAPFSYVLAFELSLKKSAGAIYTRIGHCDTKMEINTTNNLGWMRAFLAGQNPIGVAIGATQWIMEMANVEVKGGTA